MTDNDFISPTIWIEKEKIKFYQIYLSEAKYGALMWGALVSALAFALAMVFLVSTPIQGYTLLYVNVLIILLFLSVAVLSIKLDTYLFWRSKCLESFKVIQQQ